MRSWQAARCQTYIPSLSQRQTASFNTAHPVFAPSGDYFTRFIIQPRCRDWNTSLRLWVTVLLVNTPVTQPSTRLRPPATWLINCREAGLLLDPKRYSLIINQISVLRGHPLPNGLMLALGSSASNILTTDPQRPWPRQHYRSRISLRPYVKSIMKEVHISRQA